MPYRYLDEMAIADVAFEASAETLEGLFIASADATLNVMVEDLDAIAAREDREICLGPEALDLLLFEFLQELVYLKDADQLLLRAREVKIERTDDTFRLSARCQGETIDPERHGLEVDVKAVTLHRLEVEPTPAGWRSLVILDI